MDDVKAPASIEDMKYLLEHPLIKNLEPIDWGRSVAPFNEMIIKDLLKDEHIAETKATTSGYDLMINDQKIQCKLRQVNGKTPFSKNVYLETTRRHCNKNVDKVSRGHVCYSSDEFDYVFITLVHDGKRDIKDWYASMVPVYELEDNNGNLKTSVSSDLLKKYELKNFFNSGLRPGFRA